MNFLTERDECQQGHLEMLYSEGNADDGQAAENAESDMEHSYFYSSEEDPDNVHQDGQTASVIGSGAYVTSEWPEGKPRHLEQLHTEWYSYDGDTEQDCHEGIIKADHQTTQDQP